MVSNGRFLKSTGEKMGMLSSIELCAGAGGQALGLERSGFHHVAAIENDPWACATLRANRDNDLVPVETRWDVREQDVLKVDGTEFSGVDWWPVAYRALHFQ